jgi:hypothetical protein
MDDQKSTTTKFKKIAKSGMASSIAIALAVGILVFVATSLSPTNHATTTTTTTASGHVRTATTDQAAATASLSVARAALYVAASPHAQVTASDITKAAKPDKGTLVVLRNLGTLPGRVLAFEWKLDPKKPVVDCVAEPTTRLGTPTIVVCPAGVGAPKGVTFPTIKESTPPVTTTTPRATTTTTGKTTRVTTTSPKLTHKRH